MRATSSEHASAEPQTATGRRCSALDRRGRGFVATFGGTRAERLDPSSRLKGIDASGRVVARTGVQ